MIIITACGVHLAAEPWQHVVQSDLPFLVALQILQGALKLCHRQLSPRCYPADLRVLFYTSQPAYT